MATGDKWSVISVAAQDLVAIANTFYVDVIDDSGAADVATSIAEKFESAILNKIAANQSSQMVYECLLIRKVDPLSEPARVFELSVVGSRGVTSLPSNVTLAVNNVSNDGRPPFRGRWFISGLLEADVDGGRWTDQVELDWAAFLVQIPLSFGSAGETYQLQHFSDAQEQFDPIKRGRLSPIPRKLRSRTPGLCSIS